jgi:hypothetical protein
MDRAGELPLDLAPGPFERLARFADLPRNLVLLSCRFMLI